MPLSKEEQAELAALNAAAPAQPAQKAPQADPRSMHSDALYKYLTKDTPEYSKQATEAIGGLYGGEAAGQGLKTVAKATGLNKLPGYLMSKAVGLKKYIPGVGQELVDQGLVGTKGMMQGQVERRLNQVGPQISRAVEDIPGELSHEPVASSVIRTRDKFTTPSGVTTDAAAPSLLKVESRATDIADRPPGSAKELFGYKKIAQGEGYNAAGDPLAKLQSQLAQKESSGYSDVLQDAYAKAHPENPDVLSELNRKYSALKAGEKGLNRSGGYGIEALLRQSLPSSVALSGSAQALDVAGKAIPTAVRGAVQHSAPSQTNSLSPQEQAELEQLNTLKGGVK